MKPEITTHQSNQGTAIGFRHVVVPAPMVQGIHALTQSVIEEGQSVDAVGVLLIRLGALLCHRVPRASRRPPAALVLLAALAPLQSA